MCVLVREVLTDVGCFSDDRARLAWVLRRKLGVLVNGLDESLRTRTTTMTVRKCETCVRCTDE